jgi:hypothetical protein
MKDYYKMEVELHAFLTTTLDGAPRPILLPYGKEPPLLIT